MTKRAASSSTRERNRRNGAEGKVRRPTPSLAQCCSVGLEKTERKRKRKLAAGAAANVYTGMRAKHDFCVVAPPFRTACKHALRARYCSLWCAVTLAGCIVICCGETADCFTARA